MTQKSSNSTPTKGKSGLISPSILPEKLLKNPGLKGWERLFVRTLAASPRPGKKQLEKFEAIAARLKKSRKRKELTECLQVLEDSGIRGETALFILSLADDNGGAE